MWSFMIVCPISGEHDSVAAEKVCRRHTHATVGSPVILRWLARVSIPETERGDRERCAHGRRGAHGFSSAVRWRPLSW